MSSTFCTIRNYHAEDFDGVIRLGDAVRELGCCECPMSSSDVIESVGPQHRSHGNIVLIAERAGEIVGYAEVRPEFTIGRGVLAWIVHPGHRSGQLGADLIDRAIVRTRALGIMRLHANILHDSATARQLLTGMGFTFIRRFLELRIDLSGTPLPEEGGFARCFRHLRPGEEERLTRLQNLTFAGSWGYNDNTVDEILDRIRLPDCSPRDVIVAIDADKPIGHCWTRVSGRQGDAPGDGIGRIYMLGVDPAHRGKGVGRQLVLAGLSYLKCKGLQIVELTVDSENSSACELYASLGFTPWTCSLWYEKRL